MTNLADQLRAACAVKEYAGMHDAYTSGRDFENARLTPLIEKMIACVEALESVNTGLFYHSCNDGESTEQIENTIAEALIALRDELQAEVEEMK